MIDLKALLSDSDSIKDKLSTRGFKIDLKTLEVESERRKNLIQEKEKLASDPSFTPQNMSDVLGTRIAVRTINEAKLLMSELNKRFSLILNDDF